MKLAIISSSPFIKKNDEYFAYSPYAKELEIWARYSDQVAVTCPIWESENGLLVYKIPFNAVIHNLKGFNIKSFKNFLKAFQYSFLNFYLIYKSMVWADHIHLRCPGNIGLMACIVQIFFPKKSKTVKYAGNWDSNAKQPWSYKLQKWILSTTFLTKNMQVLVYGEWENSSKNIRPFFTATYKEIDMIDTPPRDLNGLISFLFVGTLTRGKQPLYAIQLIESIKTKGYQVELLIYGNGIEKVLLENYIIKNKLESYVFLMGNGDAEQIKKEYQENHFVILPSKSEGWPKVIAEGMFWGCLPIATKVSCVPNMLDNGNRGLLLTMNIKDDVALIETIINKPKDYYSKAILAMNWSRNYTVDLFENEIKKILQV